MRFCVLTFVSARPRFVSWEELIATEGAATSKFSTRDFLLDNVFDGKKGYESLTTCNIVSAALQSGKIQKHRSVASS